KGVGIRGSGEMGRWGDGEMRRWGARGPTLWGWGAMGNSPAPASLREWGLGAVGRWREWRNNH
ncbi:hypothetical protein CEN44_29300, partial [Fischerella muscicola CCMEE 5323]